MNNQQTKKMFVNPYYAININPSLVEEHEPMVSKKEWIQANIKLMDEIGQEKWLKLLLSVLQDNRPRTTRDLI